MYLSLAFPLERLPVPRVRRCGCLSLRAGALLTALLCILYSVLALSECMALAAGVNVGLEEDGKKERQEGEWGEKEEGEWMAALHWMYLLSLGAVFVTLLTVSAIMLVGVLREKAWMLRPWVAFKTLQLCGGVLFLLVGGVLVPDISWVATDFLIILVRLYMLTVVASYCRLLEGARGDGAGEGEVEWEGGVPLREEGGEPDADTV